MHPSTHPSTASKGLLLLAIIALLAGLSFAQAEKPADPVKKYPEYKSQFKKRGDVHGLVFSLPRITVFEGVEKAFAGLDLTINSEYRPLGFIDGGHSRGISGEKVLVWVDLEKSGAIRVEVRNIRISRMGLIGAATTKDWSNDVLAKIESILSAVPSYDALKASAERGSLDERRALVQRCLELKKRDEAAQAYRALLAQYPDSLLDRSRFADLLLELKQPDEAVAVLKLSSGKQADAAFSLARLYLQMGHASEAVAELKALPPASGGLKATYHLARADFLAGNTSEAVKGFEAVIAQAPDHPFAKQAKGWLQVASAGSADVLADPKRALQTGNLLLQEELPYLAEIYLKKAYDGLPKGSDKYAACHKLATIMLEREEFQQVVDLINPSSAQLAVDKRGELLFDLALADCGLPEYAKAKALAKQAEKAGFKEADALDDALKYYIER